MQSVKNWPKTGGWGWHPPLSFVIAPPEAHRVTIRYYPSAPVKLFRFSLIPIHIVTQQSLKYHFNIKQLTPHLTQRVPAFRLPNCRCSVHNSCDFKCISPCFTHSRLGDRDDRVEDFSERLDEFLMEPSFHMYLWWETQKYEIWSV